MRACGCGTTDEEAVGDAEEIGSDALVHATATVETGRAPLVELSRFHYAATVFGVTGEADARVPQGSECPLVP